jgi:hypothetical protein
VVSEEEGLGMIGGGDRELVLALVLADDVTVEERLDLRWAGKAPIDRSGLFALFFFQDLLANSYAFIADIGPWIVGRRADEFLDLLLRFVAERTTQRFVCV